MKTSASVLKQIKAANKKLADAVAAGDFKAAADMYSKKPILMPPNTPSAKTKAKIKSFWAGAGDMGVKKVTLTTAQVEADKDTAIETGAYRLAGARNKTLDTGKYVVVWKKEGKEWKLHWDIFNSNS
ncbi:MAG: YybH family protein [Gammaproteobacteria bacterium]